MLKKVYKSTIIALFQLLLLASVAFIVVSLMLNHTKTIGQWHDFFNQFKGIFLMGHCLFYLAILAFWPTLVMFLTHREANPPEPQQIKKALQMRFYLVGILILFECLTWLR